MSLYLFKEIKGFQSALIFTDFAAQYQPKHITSSKLIINMLDIDTQRHLVPSQAELVLRVAAVTCSMASWRWSRAGGAASAARACGRPRASGTRRRRRRASSSHESSFQNCPPLLRTRHSLEPGLDLYLLPLSN